MIRKQSEDQKIRRSEDQKIRRSEDQIITIAFGLHQSGREAKLTKSDGLAAQPVVIILIFYHHHEIFYNFIHADYCHHRIESIQSGERDITNIGGHMYF